MHAVDRSSVRWHLALCVCCCALPTMVCGAAAAAGATAVADEADTAPALRAGSLVVAEDPALGSVPLAAAAAAVDAAESAAPVAGRIVPLRFALVLSALM